MIVRAAIIPAAVVSLIPAVIRPTAVPCVRIDLCTIRPTFWSTSGAIMPTTKARMMSDITSSIFILAHLLPLWRRGAPLNNSPTPPQVVSHN